MNYIETICMEDGCPKLLPLHAQRMEKTCQEVGIATPNLPDIQALCPPLLSSGLTKCRVVYGATGIIETSFSAYTPRRIDSLRLVTAPKELDYHLKMEDRSALNKLHNLRNGADEIIIVRDGLLTDTSYTNIILHINEDLLTPRLPLLKGVQRGQLLKEGVIQEADLKIEDLKRAKEIILINAMLPLHRAQRIEPSCVFL